MSTPSDMYRPLLSERAEELLAWLRRRGGKASVARACGELSRMDLAIRLAKQELERAGLVHSRGGHESTSMMQLIPPGGLESPHQEAA